MYGVGPGIPAALLQKHHRLQTANKPCGTCGCVPGRSVRTGGVLSVALLFCAQALARYSLRESACITTLRHPILLPGVYVTFASSAGTDLLGSTDGLSGGGPGT